MLYEVITIPASLTPSEDRGVVYVFVRGAEGTSIERMKRNMEQVEQRLLPLVGKGVVKAISFSTPAFGRGSDQTGMLIVQLTRITSYNVCYTKLLRFRAHEPQVIEHLVPEPRVQEMEHRMLRASHVEVHGKPVVRLFRVREGRIVFRIHVAEVVPAGTGPLGHRVGLALSLSAARRIGRAALRAG